MTADQHTCDTCCFFVAGKFSNRGECRNSAVGFKRDRAKFKRVSPDFNCQNFQAIADDFEEGLDE